MLSSKGFPAYEKYMIHVAEQEKNMNNLFIVASFVSDFTFISWLFVLSWR